jgi:hypothetical protein
MTDKTKLLRSAALAGMAFAALALVPAIASAQAPRPDFPGAKQGEPQSDAAKSPRPDFPGAKQGESEPAKSPRPDFPGPKQDDSQPPK